MRGRLAQDCKFFSELIGVIRDGLRNTLLKMRNAIEVLKLIRRNIRKENIVKIENSSLCELNLAACDRPLKNDANLSSKITV